MKIKSFVQDHKPKIGIAVLDPTPGLPSLELLSQILCCKVSCHVSSL